MKVFDCPDWDVKESHNKDDSSNKEWQKLSLKQHKKLKKNKANKTLLNKVKEGISLSSGSQSQKRADKIVENYKKITDKKNKSKNIKNTFQSYSIPDHEVKFKKEIKNDKSKGSESRLNVKNKEKRKIKSNKINQNRFTSYLESNGPADNVSSLQNESKVQKKKRKKKKHQNAEDGSKIKMRNEVITSQKDEVKVNSPKDRKKKNKHKKQKSSDLSLSPSIQNFQNNIKERESIKDKNRIIIVDKNAFKGNANIGTFIRDQIPSKKRKLSCSSADYANKDIKKMMLNFKPREEMDEGKYRKKTNPETISPDINDKTNVSASSVYKNPKSLTILKGLLEKFKNKPEENQLENLTPKFKKTRVYKYRTGSLKQRMLDKLKSSRFRFVNEQFYNSKSGDALQHFKDDPDEFIAYHKGYKLQVSKWPMNPLDIIIKSIRTRPSNLVIADFGCGEARLSSSVKNKVHSFDLVALNSRVTVCDMSHTPLENGCIDVAVFCLSLMGTNLHNYIQEANRVLKMGGTLKIAEIESRFSSIEDFIKTIYKYGFVKVSQDVSHNLFCFLDFKKKRDIANTKNLPDITLKPCLYKKR